MSVGLSLPSRGELDSASENQPLLRGWIHAVGALWAVAAMVVLCWLSADDPPRLVSMLVYGLSMIAVFGVSALYHLGSWEPQQHKRLRALDHADIFIAIGGIYTPFVVNILSGWERPIILGTIWAQSLAGALLIAATLRLPRAIYTGFYVSMGWAAVVALPIFIQKLPAAAVGMVLLALFLYAAGAVVYALRHPDPFPRVFGFHEVFHTLVLAAAVADAIAIYLWVMPFPRE
jgi:hemolysin III